MAQSIGLHVDTTPLKVGLAISLDTECELRRRTWYSMYVLDRLLALQLGRPMAIRQADFHVTLPSRSSHGLCYSSETADAFEVDGTKSQPSEMDYFLHVINFSGIVENVMQDLYRPVQPEVSVEKLLADASTIDSSLLRWRASLPRHLRFDLSHTFERSVVFQRQV